MFVYGTQYLRGFTPEKDQWEKDMESMKKLGFNTIRTWMVWNAIERSEGNIGTNNQGLEESSSFNLQKNKEKQLEIIAKRNCQWNNHHHY